MRGARAGLAGIDWTPRQREVLDLLVEGKTNAEIAERLGISFDGAKWHVAEILSKLGVSSREQAADFWRRERRAHRRVGRALLAAPWVRVVALAGTAAACLAVAIVLLAILAGGAGDPEPVQPGESVTPGASPTPGATSVPVAQCPAGLPDDVCTFAAEFERLLHAGDTAAMLRDSAMDSDQGRSDLALVLKTLNGQDARLVAIGCPFAAMALGCTGTFALGFSSLPPGQNPSEVETGIAVFAFDRAPGCDFLTIYETGTLPDCAPFVRAPVLVSAEAITGIAERHAVATGGFIQGGTLAGRPLGITDTAVRSEWTAVTTDAPGSEYVNGVKVEAMQLAPATTIPIEGALLVAGGCWACEGNDASLDRVYRRPDGTLVRETLLEGEITGLVVLPGPQKLAPMVATIYATRCTRGYCGPLNALTADAASELLRSTDGGVTWERLAAFQGAADVRTFGSEIVLGRAYGEGAPAAWEYHYERWPSGERVALPDRPWIDTGDRIAVRSADGLRYLYDDGSVFWESPFGALPNQDGVYLSRGPGLAADSLVATFASGTSPGGRTAYTAIFDGGQLVRVFSGGPGVSRAEGTGEPVLGNVLVSPTGLGLAAAQFADLPSPWPAVVDYRAGTVAPIEPQFFLDAYGPLNRRRLVAFHSGPLARVSGAGDCLNVRSEPTTSAPIVACYPDGTLLKLTGEQREGDGRSWQGVLVPVGPSFGWAATEFLAW